MVIIYGRRSFGRVEAHGGEHAQTSFAHIYYMPLFPTTSFWVTQDVEGAARGFEIRANGKSILAAYLRSWMPLAAVAGLFSGGALGFMVALGCAAVSSWAWSWRSLRGATALKRSDFNVLAFHTRCEPARMPREMRHDMKRMLDERWTALGASRPPDDVAKYGAKSPDEAVVAYGLLRLAALEGAPGAREAAERIFDGTHDSMPVGDGPYRGDDQPVTSAVLDQVAAAASARAAEVASVRATVAKRPWWTPNRKIAAVVIGGAVAIAGLSEEAPSLGGTQQITSATLDSARGGERFYEVRCDRVEELTNGAPAAMCLLGDKVLPVLGAHDGTVLVGKLRDIRRGSVEWGDELRSSPQIGAVYLEVASQRTSLVAAILCMIVIAVAGGLGVKWTLSRWRARKAKPNV